MNARNGVNGLYQYSTDNITWVDYEMGTPIQLTNVGDKVYFKGSRSTQTNESYLQFSMTGTIAASGNVNSLLDKARYNSITDLTSYGAYTFCSLFQECVSLTQTPELPATTLAEGCYQSMFQACIGLVSAPELPATTLVDNCYRNMFWACTSLTQAPELPATTLTEGCYQSMFNICRSLNEVRCYATDISATDATTNWMNNVSTTGTFYKADGVTWPRSESGIPVGWDC